MKKGGKYVMCDMLHYFHFIIQHKFKKTSFWSKFSSLRSDSRPWLLRPQQLIANWFLSLSGTCKNPIYFSENSIFLLVITVQSDPLGSFSAMKVFRNFISFWSCKTIWSTQENFSASQLVQHLGAAKVCLDTAFRWSYGRQSAVRPGLLASNSNS